ncbi:hypothetical protein BH11ACT8_BH11ACT8_30410 [soil metagenome]
MTSTPRPSIWLDPPLAPSEVAFLAAFSSDDTVRRVWPRQPNHHCPWRPTADGAGLDLDPERAEADPENVSGWLRFLVQEFLAPSTTEALSAALAEGLRGGHQVNGEVCLGGVRLIRAEQNRVIERVLSLDEGKDAIVLDFTSARHDPRFPSQRAAHPDGLRSPRPGSRVKRLDLDDHCVDL